MENILESQLALLNPKVMEGKAKLLMRKWGDKSKINTNSSSPPGHYYYFPHSRLIGERLTEGHTQPHTGIEDMAYDLKGKLPGPVISTNSLADAL